MEQIYTILEATDNLQYSAIGAIISALTALGGIYQGIKERKELKELEEEAREEYLQKRKDFADYASEWDIPAFQGGTTEDLLNRIDNGGFDAVFNLQNMRGRGYIPGQFQDVDFASKGSYFDSIQSHYDLYNANANPTENSTTLQNSQTTGGNINPQSTNIQLDMTNTPTRNLLNTGFSDRNRANTTPQVTAEAIRAAGGPGASLIYDASKGGVVFRFPNGETTPVKLDLTTNTYQGVGLDGVPFTIPAFTLGDFANLNIDAGKIDAVLNGLNALDGTNEVPFWESDLKFQEWAKKNNYQSTNPNSAYFNSTANFTGPQPSAEEANAITYTTDEFGNTVARLSDESLQKIADALANTPEILQNELNTFTENVVKQDTGTQETDGTDTTGTDTTGTDATGTDATDIDTDDAEPTPADTTGTDTTGAEPTNTGKNGSAAVGAEVNADGTIDAGINGAGGGNTETGATTGTTTGTATDTSGGGGSDGDGSEKFNWLDFMNNTPATQSSPQKGMSISDLYAQGLNSITQLYPNSNITNPFARYTRVDDSIVDRSDIFTGANDRTRFLQNLRGGAEDFSGLATDTSNLASNTFGDLQVATQAAKLKAEEADQSLANTLQQMQIGGFGAAGATAIAQAALQSKLGITAQIEQEEARNNELRARGQQQVEQIRMSESKRLQDIAFSERLRLEELREREGIRIQEGKFGEAGRIQQAQLSEALRKQAAELSERQALREADIQGIQYQQGIAFDRVERNLDRLANLQTQASINDQAAQAARAAQSGALTGGLLQFAGSLGGALIN